MIGLLVLMMIMVIILVKPVRGPMFIPLLGIDWIGGLLWGFTMLCFTFVCVYGNYYDWWESPEIRRATVLGISFLVINLWRASFLHHPYVTFRALTNRNLIKATCIYLVFYTLLGTEHVFEHSYAINILGFDDNNLIDLNWYVFFGIVTGCGITYYSFALHKWRYKTMAIIAFTMAALYLGWFYFFIDYNIEKEALFFPLFFRGAASVIITIVFLTSIVQSGLPFQIFPQSVTINGFTGAVMGATFGPAVIGELLSRTMAKNYALISSAMTATDPESAGIPLGTLYGIMQKQALIVSMKEIYGWLLILALISILALLVFYSPVRPMAIFPKWRTIRKIIRKIVRSERVMST